MLIEALFLIVKILTIDRGMDKEDVVYIYNGTLLSQNKEQNNVICTNIDGPRDCQTE